MLAIVREASMQFIIKEVLTEVHQINSKETLSFFNSYSYLKKVNKLPVGPEWKCNIIEVTGDLLDDDGNSVVVAAARIWLSAISQPQADASWISLATASSSFFPFMKAYVSHPSGSGIFLFLSLFSLVY